MIPLDTYLLFLSSSALLIVAPGPDILYTFTQGLAQGRKAGIISAFGFAGGNSVHTILAGVGISAIIASSVIVFTIMKYCGAAYLFFLAYKSYSHRKTAFSTESVLDNSTKRGLFYRAFIMNVLNPKVAVFFIAFFPQFIDPNSTYFMLQTAFLGISFILLTALIFSAIGFFSGTLRSFLDRHPKVPEYINIGAAAIFLLIGIRIATYSF